ncbi:MAG TPA: DUF255 domain-containing protein [Verrucomicrobiae bacterium]|nr:DUF255 domain-containing protein [Verrucomicrobiae bacterium]
MKRLPPFRRPASGLPAMCLAILTLVIAAATPATAANHLAGQSSPYLLEHADNPIDWYPWGKEALDRARREDKPIFLSIGYSACHWCHVMEKDSFSDQEIAGLLNEAFVAIKVDREERPDLDALYMNAVIAMTGGGGWPMSVFLTPDLRPFHAGTFYPKPRFRDLVGSVGLAWRSERAKLLNAATTLRDAMAEIQKTKDETGTDTPETDLVGLAAQALAKDFDAEHGGFGKAPKFPPHGALLLLLRADRQGDARALRMATATLEAMERGGLRDQLGGGFHRYSVDAAWRVPHFEKMLSDNALLVPIYLMAWKQTGREDFRQVAEETIAFAEREMADPGGGFITSLDADTDGEEGRYYTFTPQELAAAVPAADRDWIAEYYGVTAKGDARGRSVLAPTVPDEAFAARHNMTPEALRTRLAAAKKALLQARSKRTPPRRDDKVLTAWNGLMLTALSTAHVATKDPAHLARARKTADFALRELVDAKGHPRVSWRRGHAGPAGFLDDSAFLVRGLLDLYSTDPDKRWLQAAVALTQDANRFADPSGGWFFAVDTPDLIVRPRSLDDSSLPAGNAIMVENLARLAHLTGDIGALQEAGRTVDRAAAVMRAAPTAHPYLILARDALHQARAAGPAANAAAAPGLLTRPALAADTATAAKTGGAAAGNAGAADPPAGAAPAANAAGGAMKSVAGTVVGRATRERVVDSVLKAPSGPVRPGAAVPIEVSLTIKNGWHMNSSKPTLDYLIPTKVTFTETGGATDEGIAYPPGEMVKLQFADEQLSVYQGSVSIQARLRVPADKAAGALPIVARLNYQTCSDKACLPPETVEFKATVDVAGAPLSAAERAAEPPPPAGLQPAGQAATPTPGAGAATGAAAKPLQGRDKDQLSVVLEQRGMLFVIGLVFLGGLALCLTPCVYPMIPVTVGYFSNQAADAGWGRRIGLPALYVLGIALTYSVLGVVVGLTGGLFGSMMQNPYVVGLLILLFITMALWMFGLYELRLPGFMTSLGVGRAGALGAFVMGLTLGLVAAPCVGPFIVTLLAFVAATGSPVVGFWLFFVLALGMGLPFLILGIFSGMLATLPRSGAWLIYAKKVMGVALLGVAIYFMQPFLSDRLLGWIAIGFAVVAGIWLAWIEGTKMKAAWFTPLRLVVGVLVVVVGAWLALPLVRAREEVPWRVYSEAALAEARAAHKPVLVDFFAVWCAPCRELDRHTYSDPQVLDALDRFVLLKADLTNEESTEVQSLRERYDVFGVPTVVMIDSAGADRKDLRLTGFEPPAAFLKRLEQVR